jgi:hypothetical protein
MVKGKPRAASAKAPMDLRRLQEELTRKILAQTPPAGFEESRAGTYRVLVRGNLDTVVGDFLPRTRARMGARFDQEVAAFYEARGPRTHYLRDVPRELLDHVAARWTSDPSLPRYLYDLARHELLGFEVAAARTDPVPAGLGDLALDKTALLGSGIAVVRYGFAVHLLPFELDDRSLPEERIVTLLAYRDQAHETRYLDLSPSAAAIVEGLLANKTLGAALRDAALETNVPLDDSFLVGSAELLADLGERGVILGAPL